MHERKYPLVNHTEKGLVTFNRIKLWEAIRYLSKLNGLGIVKYLDKLNLKAFYFKYIVSGTATPSLSQVIKVCDKLSLNPYAFVFNNASFNPKKDYLGKGQLKYHRFIGDTKFAELSNLTRRLLESFIKDIPDVDFRLILKKDYAVLYADYKNSPSTVCLHFILKDNKLYALHDKGLKNLDFISKEFKVGFKLFTDNDYDHYKHLFIIEQINNRIL
jgi:hypothetical protein